MRPIVWIVLVVYLVTAAVWFWVFPLSNKFSAVDITTESILFLASMVSYAIVLRHRVTILEIGWPIYAYGTLIDLLDEFTRDKDFFNDPLEDILNSFGLVLVAYGFYSAFRQRTEERDAQIEAKLALEIERGKLDAILSSIGDGVIATSADQNILFLNPSAAKICGRESKDWVGRKIHEFFPFDPESRALLETDLKAFFSGKADPNPAAAGKSIGILVGPQKRALEAFSSPIPGRVQAHRNAIFVFRDVTQRKRQEQELLDASKADSMRLLAGGVAHDFNNVLAAIQNWVALGNMKGQNPAPGPKSSPNILEKIEAACRRGKRLGTQLMSLAKGGDPIKVPVAMEKLVRDEAEFALRGSGVRVYFEFDPNLWTGNVDAGQISQVIHNLLINARQSMPDGGKVWVEMHNHNLAKGTPEIAAGKYIQVIVRDNGPGIPLELRDDIFKPYYTTKKTGSGLGLAVTKTIVTRHGGSIQVKSPLGGGTHFELLLPVSSTQVPADPERQQLRPMGGRLLLVDDSFEIREPLAMSLRESGYEVDVCESGRHAVEHYRQFQAIGTKVDLIIMDLTMPGDIGGKEAMARILALDPNAKGIIASGYHQDPVMAQFRQHGFQGVIAKPFQLDALIDIIERTLR